MAKKQTAYDRKRHQRRDGFWPDSKEVIYDKRDEFGFCTIPRTVALVATLIRPTLFSGFTTRLRTRSHAGGGARSKHGYKTSVLAFAGSRRRQRRKLKTSRSSRGHSMMMTMTCLSNDGFPRRTLVL